MFVDLLNILKNRQKNNRVGSAPNTNQKLKNINPILFVPGLCGNSLYGKWEGKLPEWADKADKNPENVKYSTKFDPFIKFSEKNGSQEICTDVGEHDVGGLAPLTIPPRKSSGEHEGTESSRLIQELCNEFSNSNSKSYKDTCVPYQLPLAKDITFLENIPPIIPFINFNIMNLVNPCFKDDKDYYMSLFPSMMMLAPGTASANAWKNIIASTWDKENKKLINFIESESTLKNISKTDLGSVKNLITTPYIGKKETDIKVGIDGFTDGDSSYNFISKLRSHGISKIESSLDCGVKKSGNSDSYTFGVNGSAGGWDEVGYMGVPTYAYIGNQNAKLLFNAIEAVVPTLQPALESFKGGRLPLYQYFVNHLTKYGYNIVKDTMTVPFDYKFLLNPEVTNSYIIRMKGSIETLYKNNGNKKVILVTNSFGGLVTKYFLSCVKQSWKDKYIESWISTSGALGGSSPALKTSFSGNSMGLGMLAYTLFKNFAKKYGFNTNMWYQPALRLVSNSLWCFPNEEVFGNIPIVSNITTKNIKNKTILGIKDIIKIFDPNTWKTNTWGEDSIADVLKIDSNYDNYNFSHIKAGLTKEVGEAYQALLAMNDGSGSSIFSMTTNPPNVKMYNINSINLKTESNSEGKQYPPYGTCMSYDYDFSDKTKGLLHTNVVLGETAIYCSLWNKNIINIKPGKIPDNAMEVINEFKKYHPTEIQNKIRGRTDPNKMIGDGSVTWLGLHLPYIWTDNKYPIYSYTFGTKYSSTGFEHEGLVQTEPFFDYFFKCLSKQVDKEAVQYDGLHENDKSFVVTRGHKSKKINAGQITLISLLFVAIIIMVVLAIVFGKNKIVLISIAVLFLMIMILIIFLLR
jgi:hypothetical protein